MIAHPLTNCQVTSILSEKYNLFIVATKTTKCFFRWQNIVDPQTIAAASILILTYQSLEGEHYILKKL